MDRKYKPEDTALIRCWWKPVLAASRQDLILVCGSCKKLKYQLVELLDLVDVDKVSRIGENNKLGIGYATGPVPGIGSGNGIVMRT